jgi:hypothetical protein
LSCITVFALVVTVSAQTQGGKFETVTPFIFKIV